MNGLSTKEYTLDSRDVAKMVQKDHAHLLRDIKGYIEDLGESNFGFTDFFRRILIYDKPKQNLTLLSYN